MLLLLALLAATGTQLTFNDFWSIAGIGRDAKPADAIKKWGKPSEQKVQDDATLLRYERGPTIWFRASGGIMIDVGPTAGEFVKTHREGPLSLFGMSCAEAAKRLSFTDAVGGYTTCKHYDRNGWFLDVTLMCHDKVSSVVVVWEPLPPEIKAQPLPEDHCN